MKTRRHLIWQLYPSYLLLALLTLAAAGWYASSSMRQFYQEQTRQSLTNHARLLSRQLLPFFGSAESPGGGDLSSIDRFCKEAGRTVPIRITVILPDGKVVGDSQADPAQMENHADRPEIREALSNRPGVALRFSDTLDKQMMYVALPFGRDAVQGVVRLSLAAVAMEEQLRALTVRLIAGGIVMALLASLVSLIISKRISRPIETMRRGADRFARGDLAHRLHPPHTIELAALASAMNEMAGELEGRIRDIARQGRESETVLASMVEGVVSLDCEERIIHLNGAAARLVGADPATLRGRSIQEVIRHRQVHAMIRDTLAGRDHVEADIRLFQNQEQILNIRCTPLLGDQGQRSGAILVISDVTRLRRLESIRRDFAANVSHEIKTPLTAIKGYVQTLQQGAVADGQEAGRFLAIIDKHVNRLTAIVGDLMQLSRLELDQHGLRLPEAPASLKKVLESAAGLCRPQAQAKNISITVVCEPDVRLRMDTQLMEQAAVNLLDNAIKYSPPQSRILIESAITESELIIRFADQGIGIEGKHLPRLFERFYRVDKSRSRQMGGTGLGLAIVKHIVQAHGGSITVESTLGKGSVFTIRLPRP